MLRRSLLPARSSAMALAACAAFLVFAPTSDRAHAGGVHAQFSPYRPADLPMVANDTTPDGPPADAPAGSGGPQALGGDASAGGPAEAPGANLQPGALTPEGLGKMPDLAAGKPAGGAPGRSGADAGAGAGAAQAKRDTDVSGDAIARLKTAAKGRQREPHPLAAALPGMDVIVCEAGCPSAGEQPQVSYAQPTTSAGGKPAGEMQPASGDAVAGEAARSMINCMAGCYDTPRSYRSAFATMDTTTAGGWSTTVVPTNAGKGSGSGNWMRRIDASRGEPQGRVSAYGRMPKARSTPNH